MDATTYTVTWNDEDMGAYTDLGEARRRYREYADGLARDFATEAACSPLPSSRIRPFTAELVRWDGAWGEVIERAEYTGDDYARDRA
ncbi:MAG: hypothetical protein MR874_05620 [Coriobacteriaceae bacterium]|nr:hypothetical protein [Coriobacteriaceae bacterium]